MSGEGPLEEQYFVWLYGHVGAVNNRNPHRSYWKLTKALFITEFIYFVPNDDNRAEAGRLLREEFLDTHHGSWRMADVDNLLTPACSLLEMLIAFAKRADFHAFEGTMEGGAGGWFWKFMENVGLNQYTDAYLKGNRLEEVERILERINRRTYKPNGQGGLFPLRHPRDDQRRVELWYQLSAYLLENRYVVP